MNWRRTIFAVAPVIAAAGVGGLGARKAPETYARLSKPSFAPPAGVFGPVWSTLYLMIGAAGRRIGGRPLGKTATLHLTQLALNGAWPVAFFGVEDKRTSLAIIAALDAALAAEILALRREDPVAAGLLLPYLAWNLFATALNASVSDPGAA